MSASDRNAREEAERAFWRNDPMEGPGTIPIEVIVKKLGEARVLLQCIDRFGPMFQGAKTILELGAGQGWASCIVKRRFPGAHVIATELSGEALSSLPQWERILGAKVDESFACRSDATSLADESVDLVFAFAAAHHFGAQRDVLVEMKRVLRPGGRGLYLYEPASSRALYSIAFKRVNRKRPQVPEDVLVPADLRAAASEAGLRFSGQSFPSLADRRPFEFLYYLALSLLSPLQMVLPCTGNFVFEKLGSTRT
jgi:SAM-dependent methyltransferase